MCVCNIDSLLHIYVNFFDLVLNTGTILEVWTRGIIIPIYENKGDPTNPDAYRGITLVSSTGKILTSVLNNR